MSGDFECFVTIGDQKHSIYLDKDMDSVIFSDVYKKLTKLDVSPVVSFANYYFEVFDFEDNCYQRLTSVEMPIKYLSRIRVLPKDSIYDSNETNSSQTKVGFKPKFNNDLFNPELIDENQVNEEFFNIEANESSIVVPKPKRPMGPTGYPYNYKNRNNESEDKEMNEEFYNKDLYFNANKRMKFRGYGDYGADDSEYYYSGPTAPPFRPYMRRTDVTEPIPGPSFADPYEEPFQQPYYRRRDDYYSDQYMATPPPEVYPNYSPYYQPNEPPFRPQMNFRPDFSNFRNDFYPRMDFSPNFQQNFPRFWNKKPINNRDRIRKEQQMSFKNNRSANVGNTETLNTLKTSGFTLETINNFDYYFCEFCEIKFKPISKAINHSKTELHLKNTNEKNLNPLDKLFLVKPNRNSPQVSIIRRQELRKFSKLDKQKLIRHGVRLKDGTGPNAYVCIRCCSSLSTSNHCHKHYSEFLDINNSINYPKDYHILAEDNSLPKIELRYRRILNALELTIDDTRSEQDLKQLIELRDEGVVLKEQIDGSNKSYFLCLVCDKRLDKEEAIIHSKSADHLKKRSPQRYKGLDRALLIDSEKSNQIEVVLARKQELEKIKFFTKELNFEHGIRLKDGIGPEAYYCVKCEQWFDSSNTVKIHVDEYDKKIINESTEESLIDSAKKQMELLSKQTEEPNKEETVEQMDITSGEDNNSLDLENCEQRFTNEGIKALNEEETKEDKYYDTVCDIYFKDKEQAVQHLNRSFHKRLLSGEFLKPVDKAFCVNFNNSIDFEVFSNRFQILEKLSDAVKQKFAEEGIRLKDGVGREAFWCQLCNDPIQSPNVESGSYAFINHINYNPKHVELLIGQNK